MSKAFVMDDEHWITVNGNHVLINGKGEVVGGMGGALKGVKLSKATSSMKGGKFKTAKTEQRELIDKHDKRNDAMINRVEKIKKEGAKKDNAYTKAINRVNRLEREADKKKDFDKADRLWKLREDLEEARSDNYNANNDKWHRLASKARENTKRTEKQIGKIDKKYKKAGEALSSARSKLKSAREANAYMKKRGTKISPLTKGGKGKFSNINKEYDEADKKYNEKVNQGNEKVRQAFNERDEKVKKLNVEHNNFEDRNRKRRMALRSTERRLQKLDGGTGKYNRLIKRVENELDKNYSESDKQSNAYANKRLAAENAAWEVSNKNSEQRAKDFDTMLKEHKKARQKEKVAKEILAKARPKIEERREAIRKYNEKNSQ